MSSVSAPFNPQGYPTNPQGYPTNPPGYISPEEETLEFRRDRNKDGKKCHCENSLLVKIISLIPIIGIIPSVIAERSLMGKLKDREMSQAEHKKAMQIQNTYTIISIIRDIATIAGTVALLAWTISSLALPLFCTLNLIILAAASTAVIYGLHTVVNHIAAIHDRNHVIKDM